MAKSGNAMNDSALESAAGGAYGVVKDKSNTFELYKDDGTYIGTYGTGKDGMDAADKILKTYGNNDGVSGMKLIKSEDLAKKSDKGGGLADRISKMYDKNK